MTRTAGVVVDKCPVDVEAITEPLELLLGRRRGPVDGWHHLFCVHLDANCRDRKKQKGNSRDVDFLRLGKRWCSKIICNDSANTDLSIILRDLLT